MLLVLLLWMRVGGGGVPGIGVLDIDELLVDVPRDALALCKL